MENRGSRLINCFQTLEKLQSSSGSKTSNKYGTDDTQQLRYLTSKILQYVSMQEKVHRELVIKSTSYVDQLLGVLENSYDTCTEQNVVYILSELIGKSTNNKRVSALVSQGATHALLQTLVFESREPNCSEELLLSIHQVLARLGPKDRKFGVKARVTQALGVTLSLLKNYSSAPKLLQPIVHVLKLYATNAVNASYLGKNGAVTHLFKVLSVCGRKHLTLVKYTLDTLTQLVKSKSNSARAIGQGCVSVLLTMYQDWHRVDCKNRHISLRKATLSVLKHITNLKSGRNALMEADGLRVLYTTCNDSLEYRDLEGLIYMASLIMRKCFPRNRLPISCLRSPLTYPLPVSDFHVPDPGEGQDEPVMRVIGPLRTGDDNGYESSIDNDDDISSDDDPEMHKVESDEEGDTDPNKDMPYHRAWEDLVQYRRFFSELYEFDAILEEEQSYGLDCPIVIPTAGGYECGASGRLRESRSSSGLQPPYSLQREGPVSESHLYRDALASQLQDLKLASHLTRDLDTLSEACGGHLTHAKLKGIFLDTSSSSFPNETAASSAVNLKTGASIFTLDISGPKTTKKLLHNRSPKTKRKSLKSSKVTSGTNPPSKEKKTTVKTKTGKSEDWFSASFEANNALSSSSVSLSSASNGVASCTNYAPQREPHKDTQDEENSEDGSNSAEMEDEMSRQDNPEIYVEMAAKTHSVGRFSKLAYPDMFGSTPPPYREPLFEKKFGTQRQKIFEDIERFINPDNSTDKVVYDLDSIVATAGPSYTSSYSNLTNSDETSRLSRSESGTEHLKFNSQFESGNLRKAIQVRRHEYDLILSPDVNTNHHHQWFYFEVSNMEAAVRYRFNIVNCEKLNSQFNFGMRPVMFSLAEAVQGRPYWVRAGTEICYYKNHFVRSSQTTGGVRGKTYFTATFTVMFRHERDVCYIAYHYPYTYTMLQYHLLRWEQQYDASQIYYRKDTLCETISHNAVPVLTITAHPHTYDRDGIHQFKNRAYIFLSSRVHPGESNSSWVMKGTINFLLSDRPAAQLLRNLYIFKIVPMLNPDGVINGNHRCSLVAEDLNRQWLLPCPKLHPTIFHTKGLLQYLHIINRSPLVYCDYHGHSRRKNVFLYGCSPSLSWMTEDLSNPAISPNKMEDTSYKSLPKILHHVAPSFSLNNCSFVVEKSKESTARVVVWRQMGVVRSYTMESSYCGCDQGPYRGCHVSTRELEEMGRKFAEGLAKVRSRHLKVAPPVVSVCSQPVMPDIGASLSGFHPTGAIATSRDRCANLMTQMSEHSLEPEGGATERLLPAPIVERLDLHSSNTSNSSSCGDEEEDEEEEDEEVDQEEEEEEQDEEELEEDLLQDLKGEELVAHHMSCVREAPFE